MDTYGQKPPNLLYPLSDEAKMQAMWDLSSAFDDVCRQVDRMYRAVDLYNYIRSQIALAAIARDINAAARFDGWKIIPARDGALCLADFHDALQGANGRLRTALGSDVLQVKPSPDDLFFTYFPTAREIRVIAAHNSQPLKNDKQRDQHAFSGKLEGPLIHGNMSGMIEINSLIGNRYTGTANGVRAYYEVTMETVARLEEVKLALFKRVPTTHRAP